MAINALTETQFFSLVSTIASQHGCRLIDINIDKRIINITGPSEAEYACAAELVEILEQYTTDLRLAENECKEGDFYGWRDLVR